MYPTECFFLHTHRCGQYAGGGRLRHYVTGC